MAWRCTAYVLSRVWLLQLCQVHPGDLLAVFTRGQLQPAISEPNLPALSRTDLLRVHSAVLAVCAGNHVAASPGK